MVFNEGHFSFNTAGASGNLGTTGAVVEHAVKHKSSEMIEYLISFPLWVDLVLPHCEI